MRWAMDRQSVVGKPLSISPQEIRIPVLFECCLPPAANRNVKSNQGYTPLDVAKFPDYAPNNEVISELEKPISPTTSR